MFNFLIRIFTILSLSYSGNLLAMMTADEDDLNLSKKSFLISGAPYNEKDQSRGVMTLCFKPVNGFLYDYEHAALVFEMFVSETSHVQAIMIHHIGESMPWGHAARPQPRIESRDSTLTKVYRSALWSWDAGELRGYALPEYRRYASWVLPNKNLLKGYDLVKNDIQAYKRIKRDHIKKYNNPAHEPKATNADRELQKKLYYYNCNHYVQRIMKEVGISVEFVWWWPATAEHLKELVDKTSPSSKKYSQITLLELPSIKERK